MLLTNRLLTASHASLAFLSLLCSGEEPTLEQRLEKLTERLEEARVEAHIPGMSVAIVKDDQIVFARGFGKADLETGAAADEDTIYAIGSTTKAFTANLIGMLVDEGKLNWDDPVTDFLPDFDLQVQSEDPGAECTLRDLLSHRHGFARMGILWYGGNVSREEILRTAAGAEPFDDFRKAFHYCNVTYLAAGQAAGVADDTSWDELMFERIFEPLEMGASTLSIDAAQKDERLALGYRWEPADEAHEHARMMNLDNIGPAGSINSNVLDVAQWIRLQLGRGEVDGMRLITAERIRETWSPQIGIGGGAGYGLGWMLREHDGRKVVEHGGNIAGFSAQIAMVPSENLGFVLLMNLDTAPLQQASIPLVLNELFDSWDTPTEAAPAVEASTQTLGLEAYAGTYLANFANFQDADFEVTLKNAALHLDIPGQQVFELHPPDDKGLWVTTLTDQLKISFQRDSEHNVVGLTVHQGPYTFEVPRKGIEILPEVPAEQLQPYCGTYKRVRGGKKVKLFLKHGRLVMEDRGRLLPFHTPGEDGHAELRIRADQGATFELDGEGKVTSFVFHGDAGDQPFLRIEDEEEADLPSLGEVMALRKTQERSAAFEANRGAKISGEAYIAQSGVRGTITLYSRGGDRYARHLDFGKFGRIDTVACVDEAWSYSSMGEFRTLKGDHLAQALLDRPAAADGDWRKHFDKVEVLRNEKLRGRPTHVLKLTKASLPPREFWIDAETGDLLQSKFVTLERSVRLPMTTRYFDFTEIDGIRHPRRIESENPATGRTVLTFDDIQNDIQLDADVFVLTPPEESDD